MWFRLNYHPVKPVQIAIFTLWVAQKHIQAIAWDVIAVPLVPTELDVVEAAQGSAKHAKNVPFRSMHLVVV